MGTIELFWRLLKGLVESGMRCVEGMMESTQLVQSWRLQVSPFNSSRVHKGKWTQGSRIQASLWSSFHLTTPFIEMLLWGLCPSWLFSLSFLITSTCAFIAFTCNFSLPWVFIFNFNFISPQRNRLCPCFKASLWLRQEGKGSSLELHLTQPALVKTRISRKPVCLWTQPF